VRHPEAQRGKIENQTIIMFGRGRSARKSADACGRGGTSRGREGGGGTRARADGLMASGGDFGSSTSGFLHVEAAWGALRKESCTRRGGVLHADGGKEQGELYVGGDARRRGRIHRLRA